MLAATYPRHTPPVRPTQHTGYRAARRYEAYHRPVPAPAISAATFGAVTVDDLHTMIVQRDAMIAVLTEQLAEQTRRAEEYFRNMQNLAVTLRTTSHVALADGSGTVLGEWPVTFGGVNGTVKLTFHRQTALGTILERQVGERVGVN